MSTDAGAADKTEKGNRTCSKVEEDLDKLFLDRYTEDHPSYAEINSGFAPVIVMHPWTSKPKRTFDYSRGGRGGGRGGFRGGFRGGRDNYRDNYRGNYQRRRSWNEDDDSRGGKRVHYPGRR